MKLATGSKDGCLIIWDIDPVTANRIETGMRTLTDAELLLILKVLEKGLSDLDDLQA